MQSIKLRYWRYTINCSECARAPKYQSNVNFAVVVFFIVYVCVWFSTFWIIWNGINGGKGRKLQKRKLFIVANACKTQGISLDFQNTNYIWLFTAFYYGEIFACIFLHYSNVLLFHFFSVYTKKILFSFSHFIYLWFPFIHYKWTRMVIVDFALDIREKKRLTSYTHERIARKRSIAISTFTIPLYDSCVIATMK